MMSTTNIFHSSGNQNISISAHANPPKSAIATSSSNNSTSIPNRILDHVQGLNNAGVSNFVAGDYVKSIEIFTECLSIMRCEIQKRAATAGQTAISSEGHDTSSSSTDILNYSHFSYKRVTRSDASEETTDSMATTNASSTATMMDIDIEVCNKSVAASATTLAASQATPATKLASTSRNSTSQGHSFVFDCPLEVTSVHTSSNVNSDEEHWNCELYETKFLFVILFNLALSHQVYGMTVLQRHPIAHRESLRRALSLYELTHRMLYQSVESSKDTYFEMIMIVNNLSIIFQELGNDDEAKMCQQQLLSAVMLLVDNGEHDVLEEINGVLNNVIPQMYKKFCCSAPAA